MVYIVNEKNLFFRLRNPVRSNAITRFDLNIVKPLLKRKGFKKAMLELELILQVPDGISLFKR